MTRLAIVIVNWNAGSLLRNCLNSIECARLPDGVALSAVLVVDNASTDGSADDLKSRGLPLCVIRNAENVGFAAACNLGARRVKSDLLLFLNPDTRLYKDSLSTSVSYLHSPQHANVGVVGIQLVDCNGVVSRCSARFPQASHFAAQCIGLDRLFPATGHLMREWDHASTRHVDQVIGAFFLVRRSVFDLLNGFDERFFVYFEEVDFALRALRAGWKSAYVAEAQALHVGGGTSQHIRARRLFYSLRSRLLYGRKHFTRSQQFLLQLTTWLFEPVSRAAHLLFTGRMRELTDLASAYCMLATDRPVRQRNHQTGET